MDGSYTWTKLSRLEIVLTCGFLLSNLADDRHMLMGLISSCHKPFNARFPDIVFNCDATHASESLRLLISRLRLTVTAVECSQLTKDR